MPAAVPARPLRGALLLAVVLCAAPVAARAGDSLRCGSRIVSVQAVETQVRSVCGEPNYIDRWDAEQPLYGRSGATTEVWYYNFGANQLLRLLRFRNDRLVSVDTDGYGWDRTPSGVCGPADVQPGQSKYRLLLNCGEPYAHRSYSALRSVLAQPRIYRQSEPTASSDYVTPVHREEWTYNFGAEARQKTVVLENGWVIDVSDGERGFDNR